MGKSKEGLSAFQSVLVVLLMIAGAGAFLKWNFDQHEEFRPFKGYAADKLDELATAYGETFERLDERYQKIAATRPDVRERPLLGDRVNEFERVHQIAEQTRKAGHEVSYVMADQKNLKREMWIRQHPIQFFWDTATTF